MSMWYKDVQTMRILYQALWTSYVLYNLYTVGEVNGVYNIQSPSLESDVFTDYPATVAGIVLGSIVALIIIVIFVIVMIQVCCKGKDQRHRRRLVAPSGDIHHTMTGSPSGNLYPAEPIPPPAYDTLYPEGTLTSRDHHTTSHGSLPAPPYSPPPQYTASATHI